MKIVIKYNKYTIFYINKKTSFPIKFKKKIDQYYTIIVQINYDIHISRLEVILF